MSLLFLPLITIADDISEHNYITFIVVISKSGADNTHEVCSTFGSVFDIVEWTDFESSDFNIIGIDVSSLGIDIYLF